jgi:glucose-1-phosphate adenylyltransferase
MSTNATGIIFSNMHDEEMHEITNSRTMGAVPYGGRYRLIDFALSNMHNSGVTSVGVVAKSNYQSLLEHLGSGKEWDLSRKRDGLYIFPPFSRLSSGIYKNKIEAISGILNFIKKSKNDYIFLTDCDTLCSLDWTKPLQFHMNTKADITLICYYNNSHTELKNQTIYTLSKESIITDILLKQTTSSSSHVGTNMWVISKSLLISLIEDAVAHNYEDLEKDILQKKIKEFKVVAWKFNGYIRKINDMCDFFHGNMDILNPTIRNELFYKNGPIYTKVLDAIPARYEKTAKVSNSLISDGCIIAGEVENSILFRGVKVGKATKVSNSILMKDCKTGENVNLNYVLADKNVNFSDNRILTGYDLHPIYISKDSTV